MIRVYYSTWSEIWYLTNVMDVDSKSEMYIARPLFKPSMQSIWKDTIIVVYHITNEENRTSLVEEIWTRVSRLHPKHCIYFLKLCNGMQFIWFYIEATNYWVSQKQERMNIKMRFLLTPSVPLTLFQCTSTDDVLVAAVRSRNPGLRGAPPRGEPDPPPHLQVSISSVQYLYFKELQSK